MAQPHLEKHPLDYSLRKMPVLGLALPGSGLRAVPKEEASMQGQVPVGHSQLAGAIGLKMAGSGAWGIRGREKD